MNSPTAAHFTAALEPVLHASTAPQGSDGGGLVPGIVAGVTTDTDTVFLGSSGRRAMDDEAPMTPDTVFSIFSTTKALTATAALQLVEDGRLDLDAPAREYEPRLGQVEVIEGFADDGSPRLRPPATELTTRQLLTHTAGFGYDFFNDIYLRLSREHGVPNIVGATLDSLRTPLLFDPGTRWEYGTNIDWAGLVVEGVTGKRLGTVMSERIFSPLGMVDTGFTLDADARARLAVMHHRNSDGSLTPNHRFGLAPEPEVHMGGHGLHSTVRDYLKFIRMWLADGLSDSGEQVLRPETIRDAERNHLTDGLTVTALSGVDPRIANDAEFFPGQEKSWALSFMRNEEDAHTGRSAGSLSWAGLANLYFWIDRNRKIGGYWASQILPFADPAALEHYFAFETAAYDALQR